LARVLKKIFSETELKEAGFIIEAILGVVGPALPVPDLDDSWKGREKRKMIMDMVRMLEHECVIGPRIMGGARKALDRDRWPDQQRSGEITTLNVEYK